MSWDLYQTLWNEQFTFILIHMVGAGVLVAVAYEFREWLNQRRLVLDEEDDVPETSEDIEVDRILSGFRLAQAHAVAVTTENVGSDPTLIEVQAHWDDWERDLAVGAQAYGQLQELSPVEPAPLVPSPWDPTVTGQAFANYAPQGAYVARHRAPTFDYKPTNDQRTLSPRWRELVNA